MFAGRAAGALVAVAIAVPSFAIGAQAQTRPPASAAEWDMVKPLFKLVEQTAAGELPPSNVASAWQSHFFKADAGVVFVPFTVQLAPGAFRSFPLAMYVRVVLRGAPAPAPGPRDPLAQYPFEDAAIADRPQDGRISRAFTAPPGRYDVYVALADRPDAALDAPRQAVIKQAVDVPEFDPSLAVSSIVVVERSEADARSGRPSFEEQLNDPYALWGSRLTPALGTLFTRSEKLAVLFLVYNTAPGPDGKPDVEVQYTFYRKSGGAEAFFTRTSPERLNAATLGSRFSLAAGDLVIAGQQVPLTRFPDGDYRLEIAVADRIGGSSLARDVSFTVAGS